MVVDEEGQLAQGCELIREGLGELPETTLEAAPAIQKGHQVLPELRRVALERTDEIREQDEWIFVASLQREPRGAASGRAQEVGVLREDGRLPIPGRGVHEREPMTLRASQTIE